MTTIQITLPDQLAQDAQRAGLLASARLEQWLREQLTAAQQKGPTAEKTTPDQDPAFGMWQDRTDMADTAAYLRQVRAQRVGSNLHGQP